MQLNQQRANQESAKKTEEENQFLKSCQARNEYLQQMQQKIEMSESMTKLRDRELIKSVWFNQTERGHEGTAADMLAS